MESVWRLIGYMRTKGLLAHAGDRSSIPLEARVFCTRVLTHLLLTRRPVNGLTKIYPI